MESYLMITKAQLAALPLVRAGAGAGEDARWPRRIRDLPEGQQAG